MELNIEVKRAIARGAQKVNAIGSAVAPINFATIQEGDVFTIPQNWKDNILEQPIRGSFIEEPVTDANGIELGKKKVPQKAVYVMLEATRDTKKVAVQFYPSYFTKSRRDVADGEFKTASGSVVDEVQKYATMDDAFEALVGKTFKATSFKRFKTLRFGSETETQNAWVPQFDFVEA